MYPQNGQTLALALRYNSIEHCQVFPRRSEVVGGEYPQDRGNGAEQWACLGAAGVLKTARPPKRAAPLPGVNPQGSEYQETFRGMPSTRMDQSFGKPFGVPH